MSNSYLTPAASNDASCVATAHTKFKNFRKHSILAVIHIGQTHCTFTVYSAPDLKYVASAQQELTTNSPQAGWYEQDANEIIEAVYKCSYRGCTLLPSLGYMRSDIEALAVTNQRETLIVWDVRTGVPLYKAILANDARAADIAEDIISKLPKNDFNHFKEICGLPVLPYFLALKIRWLQKNVPAVKAAMKCGHCKVGTLDTWVIWKLTRGMLHITDVTNASHTLLMNNSTLDWDEKLLNAFCIQPDILPEIRSCAEDFGTITASQCVLAGIRIGGVIADQQATLLGQMCMHKGQTIVNFGSSLNLLFNTGKRRVQSRELLTVVAYKLGTNAPCIYALEGAVPYCGSTLNWLQNKVHMMSKVPRVLTDVVGETNDVFFVPALRGLHAPFWRKDARGIIIGLTEKTTRSHIRRAALESICFQACDIIEAVKLTGEYYQNVIYAGGEYATNALLMQMLADISGATVVHYGGIDSVSYGAAICAGTAVNVINLQRFELGVWRLSIDFETYVPLTRSEKRMLQYIKWRRAVSRSLSWLAVPKPVGFMAKNRNYLLLGSLFSGILIAALIFVLKARSSPTILLNASKCVRKT